MLQLVFSLVKSNCQVTGDDRDLLGVRLMTSTAGPPEGGSGGDEVDPNDMTSKCKLVRKSGYMGLAAFRRKSRQLWTLRGNGSCLANKREHLEEGN